MLMKMTGALTFAVELIAEVVEEVDANYGSPPFPNLEKLEAIGQQLAAYLTENREEIDQLDTPNLLREGE